MTAPRRVVSRAPSNAADGSVGPTWLMAALCFIISAIPATMVIPGPLRGNGSPARLIALLCFTLVMLAFFLPKNRRMSRGKPTPGVVILVAYFLILLVTYGLGGLRGLPEELGSNATRTLMTLICNVGVALYILKTIRTPRQREIVLAALVAGITYACFVGLLQSFSVADLRQMLVPPGFSEVMDFETQLSDRNGATRANGTSAHPIEFSVLAAAAVPLAMHFTRFAEKSQHRQLAVIATFVTFMAVPTGVSRSGVIVFVVAFLVYVFGMRVRLLGNVAIIGLAGLLAYKIFSPGSVNALIDTIKGSSSDESVAGRTQDYASVSLHFHDHPWFGGGLGTCADSGCRVYDNQWLGTLVQGGLVGIASLLLLLFGGLAGLTAGLRSARTPKQRDFVYATGAGFLGILASSLTFDLFAFLQATSVMFVLFGLLWSAASYAPDEQTEPQPPDSRGG
jgi:O-antigen ligase